MDLYTWIWLGAGATLMVLELAVPGLVIVFLGMAALVIGGLRYLGVLVDHPTSIAVWMTLSVLFAVSLRSVLRRWLPAEVRHDVDDERLTAIQQIVDVVTDVDARDGRIRYQGTTWPARTPNGSIPAGRQARLVRQDNLHWIVEPVPDGLRAELEALDDD